MPLTTVQLGMQGTPQFYGFKNRLINGGMVLDQRNAGASVTPTGAQYLTDRWQLIPSQASKLSFQQNAGSVTPPAGFNNYLGATSLSAYSLVTSDYFLLTQKIEGFNTADLGWGTASAKDVTVSFWVRSSLTGTFGAVIRNNAGNRVYPFTYTISAANTWEYETITIAGDTTGTWLTDNSIGVEIDFGLGVASNLSATAGAWTTGGLGATGATSVVGTNGATFYITGVQFEVGVTATGFDYRPYGTELALCQRYCRVYGGSTTLCTALSFTGANTSGTLMFGQTMRAAPTITANSATQFQATSGAGVGITSTGVSVFSTTADSTELQIVVASGLTVGQASVNRTLAGGILTVSAEL